MTTPPCASLIAFVVIAACLYATQSMSDEPVKAEKPAADSMRG